MTRPRLFYGWWIVAALSVTEPVTWGILYYAFSVFIEPTSAELGWSRNQLTAAFSVALLASGIAAVPVGRWLDRHGARWLMTGGSIGAAVLVVAWSRVESYPQFVAVWIGLGVCMAATFYEPAFATITTWFHVYRSRALTVLTFGGGFASVIFIPLAAWLVDRQGWRDALIALAALLAVSTIPLHALVLRRHPEEIGTCADGECDRHETVSRPGRTRAAVALGPALRSRSFRWLSLAFGLAMFVNVATTVLLIPLLIDRGESARFAAAAAAGIGLLALPGRLIFTPLGDWLPPWAVPGAIFLHPGRGVDRAGARLDPHRDLVVRGVVWNRIWGDHPGQSLAGRRFIWGAGLRLDQRGAGVDRHFFASSRSDPKSDRNRHRRDQALLAILSVLSIIAAGSVFLATRSPVDDVV
ncbi:MAG: MFS transporter [Thermomicrobiales bacterium]